MEPVSPVFRSPFTDINAEPINTQLLGECASIELKAMECLEAYGLDRGKRKCTEILADFRECVYKDKQLARIEFMRAERMKKIKEGSLDPNDTKYDPTQCSFN